MQHLPLPTRTAPRRGRPALLVLLGLLCFGLLSVGLEGSHDSGQALLPGEAHAEGAGGPPVRPGAPAKDPAQQWGEHFFNQAVSWINDGKPGINDITSFFAHLHDVQLDLDDTHQEGYLRLWFKAPDKFRQEWRQERVLSRQTAITTKILSGGRLWIVPSAGVRKRIEAVFARSAPPIIEVPVSVDEAFLEASTPPPRTSRTPVVASVNSCFSPEKGIAVLLHAAHTLRAAGHAFQLVLAGTDDHPELQHRRGLERLVNRLDLASTVELTGYLDRAAVRALMERADILVDARTTPSFSSVALEAQFAVCALVFSSASGANAVASDGENGLVFAVGDAHDLAEKIAGLLKSAKLRERLHAGCREWVRRYGGQYREGNCFERIEALHESIARRRREASRTA